MKLYNHFIDGKWIEPTKNEYFDTENPFTGEVWAKVARGCEKDADLAVKAAKAAFDTGAWADMRPTQRGKLLVRLAEIIERESERLANIEVRDNGKLITEMSAQTKYLAEWYRYFGGLADKIEGAVLPADRPGIFNYTRYEPLGVIGMITAWNSPLLLLAWKLAPAMPVTLELGGKSPNIVFEDADFEAAVMGAISGIFAATGQTCIAGSRLLVQRTIHDKFVKRLVEVASEAKIGDPMSVETHVGPVTTAPQYEKILQYIEVAKEDGATCVLGGKPYTGDGIQGDRFVEPTIFTGVTNNMRIAQEEVFGPILSVIPFDTEEDAIRIGNDIVFGLAAGVWTSDLGRAFRMSEKLKAGTVWVNTYRAVSFMTPFGGYKRSGQGRESGQESIKEFMQVKSVWIAQQTTSSNPFIMQ